MIDIKDLRGSVHSFHNSSHIAFTAAGDSSRAAIYDQLHPMPDNSVALLSSLAHESKNINNTGTSVAPLLEMMNKSQSKEFSNNLPKRRNDTIYETISGSRLKSFSPENETNGRMGTF